MDAPQRSVPDLLRRFATTPFGFSCPTFRMETNDPRLLAAIQTSEKQQFLSGNEKTSIRLIRDADAPRGGVETTLIFCGAVRTIVAGRGTVIFVDAERREILGFLAGDISSERAVSELLPLAGKLLSHKVNPAILDVLAGEE